MLHRSSKLNRIKEVPAEATSHDQPMRGGNRIGDAGLGEKVRLLALTAALTTALVLAASARAESLQIKHRPWHALTTHQKVVVLKKQIHKDKCVIRFWKHHRELAAANTTLDYKARTQTHWARVSLRIANKHLRSLMAASHRYVASGGIAHEALWLCIHRGEGAWNANTGNGYYGGLQMTSGWGGVDRPDLLSPYAQMALAERQYRASHYSTAWLGQQWPNTSPPCLSHA